MLFCVVSKKEIAALKDLVMSVDDSAFVIVCDAREVWGEGFQSYHGHVLPDKLRYSDIWTDILPCVWFPVPEQRWNPQLFCEPDSCSDLIQHRSPDNGSCQSVCFLKH